MSPAPPDPLHLWGWLLDARADDLLNFEWMIRRMDPASLLRDPKTHRQQCVPAFDRMEQKILDGAPDFQRFQRRVTQFLKAWDEFLGWPDFGEDAEHYARAASRMLVRLLRHPTLGSPESDWVQRQLDERLPRRPLGLPDMSDQAVRSAAEIDAFIKWENEHNLGRHRLLFPVYIENPPKDFPQGAVVAAEVSLVGREGAPDSVGGKTFVLAPWSWFTWVDLVPPEGTKVEGKTPRAIRFKELTENLRKALVKTGTITPDGADGCLVDGRSVVFVIDLQPLSVKRDFKNDRDAHTLQAQAWWCGSHEFVVRGYSLGLTLAFAAWAVSERRAVCPLIATGEVTGANIVHVDGKEAKCEAINRFREASGLAWRCVFPYAWVGSKEIHPGTIRPDFPQDLKKAFELDLLIDGFDDYRIALGVQGGAPAPGVAAQLRTNHELLNKAREVRTPSETGYAADDHAAAQAVCERLTQWFRAGYPDSAVRGDEHLRLTAPFGEDPQVLADWLLAVLRGLAVQGRLGPLGAAPVVVPVPLLGLVEGSGLPNRCTLPDRLAAAIRSHFEGVVEPTANHLGIALRNDRKLVLLVYPPASLDWWERLAPDPAARADGPNRATPALVDRVVEELRALTVQAHSRFARQVVVWICSDLHHQYRLFPADRTDARQDAGPEATRRR